MNNNFEVFDFFGGVIRFDRSEFSNKNSVDYAGETVEKFFNSWDRVNYSLLRNILRMKLKKRLLYHE